MDITASAGQPGPGEPGGFRADLATSPASARQARATIRHAMAAWGMDDPSGDAELLASELVANAAEHARSQQIGFVLRRHTERDGQRGVTCEVTDTSPALPQPRQASTSDERGRGLAIVAALASTSGVRPETGGKTAWFTLTLRDRQGAGPPTASPNPKPGRNRTPQGGHHDA
jgi:anti-sigma regulatory factor (Ser/Thr protein kinase)